MNNIVKLCCTGLVALALGIAWVGCETQPVASNVTVDPPSATVGMGQSVTFTASGGFDYTWGLSDHTLGTLSTTTGDTTTYTSLSSPAEGSTAVQVLTVVSSIEGSANGSNAVPDEWTTEVYITHI